MLFIAMTLVLNYSSWFGTWLLGRKFNQYILFIFWWIYDCLDITVVINSQKNQWIDLFYSKGFLKSV